MSIIKIVFDLDGVLRDLNAYLCKLGIPYPKEWVWKYEGKDVFEWIKQDNYKALTEAPETKYSRIAKTYTKDLEIWTCQPLEWREHTYKWLNEHIGRCVVRFLTTEEKEERLNFLTHVVLVEDSPDFKSYNKIALIDTPYNKNVHAEHRITTPAELRELCLLQKNEQHLKA